MSGVWETVRDVYNEYMDSGDPRVTSWFPMQSPVPTFVMVGLYLAFVKVIGPAWMMNRKPFDLRLVMFVYNMSIVIVCVYFLCEGYGILIAPHTNLVCRRDDPKTPAWLRVAEMGWWYLIFKFVEFVDTAFFVLRKKDRHISKLHVIHHAFTPIAVWFSFRIEPGDYNYFFPMINTCVHAIMYFYYGLAALGPKVQKYLWWKKYLTILQVVQFVMVLVYVCLLILVNCRISKFVIFVYVFDAGMFLIMFCHFYITTYLKKKKSLRKNE